MAVHGGEMPAQTFVIQNSADIPGGLAAPFTALRPGKLHSPQGGPLFQLIQEGKVDIRDPLRLEMAALLIAGIPVPLGLVDGRNKADRHAEGQEKMAHPGPFRVKLRIPGKGIGGLGVAAGGKNVRSIPLRVQLRSKTDMFIMALM